MGEENEGVKILGVGLRENVGKVVKVGMGLVGMEVGEGM